MYWGEWGLLPLLSVSACDFLLWLSSLSLSLPPFFSPSFKIPLLFLLILTDFPSLFPFPSLFLHPLFMNISLCPRLPCLSLSLSLSFSFTISVSTIVSLSLSPLNSVSVTVFSCPSIFLFLFCSLFYSLPGLWHPLPPPSLTLSANESFKLRVFGLNCWPIVNAKVWSIESK